ncbi:hypothetical protein ACFCV9_17970 [Streptomyces sp. NPDC056367]
MGLTGNPQALSDSGRLGPRHRTHPAAQDHPARPQRTGFTQATYTV